MPLVIILITLLSLVEAATVGEPSLILRPTIKVADHEFVQRVLTLNEYIDDADNLAYDGVAFSNRNAIIARKAMAIIVTEDRPDISWEGLRLNQFVSHCLRTHDEDALKAAVLVVGDLSARGVDMPGFDARDLCEAVVRNRRWFLADYEFDFVRQHVKNTVKIHFFTPLAMFHAVKCPGAPLPLQLRVKILREWVVRATMAKEDPDEEWVQKPVVSEFAEMAAVLSSVSSVNAKRLVSQESSVMRDWLSRYFKQMNSILCCGKLNDDRSTTLTAFGRGIGLSLVLNVPVGFNVDMGRVLSSSDDSPLGAIKRGFYEIVPKRLCDGGIISFSELETVLQGRPGITPILSLKLATVVVNYSSRLDNPFRTILQGILRTRLFTYLEQNGKVNEFVRIVTGQRVVPFSTDRVCPTIQIVFVDPAAEQLPSADRTLNAFYLPEYSKQHLLVKGLDRFFERNQ